jgi:DNA-binding MarR family transcriptional regulator
MSSRFIQEKTGCSESSVSRAIAVLVAKGLIEVRDSEGQLLLTATQRKRRKQMYFALKDQPPRTDSFVETVTDAGLHYNGEQNSHIREGSEPTLQIQHLEELEKLPQIEELSDAENDKTVTGEEVQEINTVNNAGSAFTSTDGNVTCDDVFFTAAGVPSIEANNSAIRDGKTVIPDTNTVTDDGVLSQKPLKNVPKRPSNCGTTKETQTKENLKYSFVDRQNDDLQNDGCSDLPHFEGLLADDIAREPGETTMPFELSKEARQVLNAYRQQFREYFPNRTIPKATQSDFEKLEGYFAKHQPQVLISLLPQYFTIDYDFNSRNEYSLHAFVHSVNILLYGMKRWQTGRPNSAK